MIRTLPTSKTYTRCFKLYVILYFIFLFAPLFVTCVLAFNDSQFPSLPWKGFTLDWFTADEAQRVGIFHDQINMTSIGWLFLLRCCRLCSEPAALFCLNMRIFDSSRGSIF